MYRKSMQEVVSAVGKEVEVANNLLVLLLSKFLVCLRVAHLQHLEGRDSKKIFFLILRTFSRTRKARTPVRVATPILNNPPSSPESIT